MQSTECKQDGQIAESTDGGAETLARHLAESQHGTLALRPHEMKQLRREWNAARAKTGGHGQASTHGGRGNERMALHKEARG
ncbi:MAG: hypothetical protein ACRERD_21195 [Candidatus Binatia bacterium]